MSLFNALPKLPKLPTSPGIDASDAEWDAHLAHPAVQAWEGLASTVKASIELEGTITSAPQGILGRNKVVTGQHVAIEATRLQDDREDYRVKPIYRTIIRQGGLVAWIGEYKSEAHQEAHLNEIIALID